MNKKDLSEQMRRVLGRLDSQGAMPVHQLHIQLYDAVAHPNRRVCAASLCRTIRRLEARGLLFSEGEMLAITQSGRRTLHPEEYRSALEQAKQSVREAVKRAIAECPELQQAIREASESEARWQEIFKANGWR